MGGIDIDAAKTELKAFKKHVIPVAEYFDYKRLLYVVIILLLLFFVFVVEAEDY